jgi:transcription antitermination factor NusG
VGVLPSFVNGSHSEWCLHGRQETVAGVLTYFESRFVISLEIASPMMTTMPSRPFCLLALLPVAAAWLLHLPPAFWRPAAATTGVQVGWTRDHLAHVCRTGAPALKFDLELPDDDEDEDKADEDNSALAEDEYEINISQTPAVNMTVEQLRTQLKMVGQKSSGTKKELVERVQMLQRRHALNLPVHDLQVQNQEEFRWYMLQTANGFERAVERTINMAVVAQRLTNKIERVFVPVLEGETSVRESSVMPQYIFVRMRMDPKLHFFITNMQYVINFVGADRGGRSAAGQMAGNRGFVRPMPMTDEAFEKIVALTRAKTMPTADEGAVGKVDVSSIAIADVVEVCEGPFKGMQGPVLERSPLEGEANEQALTLVLSVMGRDTPVTVPERHCAKIAQAV